MEQREAKREIERLKKFLLTRPSLGERALILRRIKELREVERRSTPAPEPPRIERRSVGVLGLIDRPVPSSQPNPQQPQPAAPLRVPPQPQPVGEEPRENQLVAHSPSPEEIERAGKQLVEIAERIVLLRRAFVTNPFSFEIDQEAEAYLARLQQIASTIPREAAEQALGQYRGYLDQKVRIVKRPQIPEQVQQLLLPPSAPSAPSAEWKTDLYFEVRSMKREPEPVRPVGYVPDGLQSLVS